MTLSITKALSEHYRATPSHRGDEDALHMSDAWKCPREVWARRNGIKPFDFTDATRTKFALGNAAETHVFDAIVEPLKAKGWEIERGRELNVSGVIGHVDLLATRGDERIVIEVKSTTFIPRMIDGKRQRRAPAEASWHYVMQACAYALALGAAWFCVFVLCRESGMTAEFWFETDVVAPEVRARMTHLRIVTAKDAPEPVDALPDARAAWECAFCDHAACQRNTNPLAMRVTA